MQLIYDAIYAGTAVAKHNLKLGNQLPAEIVAEIDRKIDDGNARTGTFRYSSYNSAAAEVNCNNTTTGVWRLTDPVESNCGGATLF